MISPHIFRNALWLTLVLTFAASAAAQPATLETPELPPAVEAPPETDITARSEQAIQELGDIGRQLDELGNIDSAKERLAALQAQYQGLLPEGVSIELSASNGAEYDADNLRAQALALSKRSTEITDELSIEAEALEDALLRVRTLADEWQQTLAESDDLAPALAERISTLLKTAVDHQQTLTSKLNDVVEAQNQALDLFEALRPLTRENANSGRTERQRLVDFSQPPLWRLTADGLSNSSRHHSRSFAARLGRDADAFFSLNGPQITIHLMLLVVVVALLHVLKRNMASSEERSAALNRPIATGVLVWLLLSLVIYGQLPATINTLMALMMAISAFTVLVTLIPERMRTAIYIFVAIFIADRLAAEFPAGDALPRVLNVLLAIAMFTVAAFGARAYALDRMADWGVPRSIVRAAVVVTAALCAVGLVLNALGNVHLSTLLVRGAIRSAGTFLILFTGLTIITDMIRLTLGLQSLGRLRSIANNRNRIVNALRPLLTFGALLFWLFTALFFFGIDDIIIDALKVFLDAGFAIGKVEISIGPIAAFIVAIWIAIMASRIVRALLRDDVLPRLRLPRGIPHTISTTAHYTIVTVGLLIGVGFLGIDLSSLAFIVGALGVGIGFGLQNVVNNFVSGLILIFERPVQVGDTVEVGPLTGRITTIGMRTSRIRTYGGSEVIVPNGDLVSNQVINWTLSDKERRLEIVVGVAYASDPDQVSSILMDVARAEEEVMNEPEPMVVFEAFGDSALEFRLYAWIPDFDQGLGVRSKLTTAINKALLKAGIEIPYPQRDLHVRSVAPEADSILGPARP